LSDPPIHEVVWTAAAASDLRAIVDYIRADSPGAAKKMILCIEQRAKGLDQHPERGRLVPELLRVGLRRYRELVISPYRLVYRQEGRTVFVLGLFDARRDLEDVLLERALRR
jgi:addiction module RelE/StbE family toxin